jgi:hypothetical protein
MKGFNRVVGLARPAAGGSRTSLLLERQSSTTLDMEDDLSAGFAPQASTSAKYRLLVA